MGIFDKCTAYDRADKVKAEGLYPYFHAMQENEGPVVTIGGKEIVMAGSNNYLGLTAHPAVKEAAMKAVEKYGTSCSGSRYLTGTIDLHEELEYRLAKFMGKEAALLFSTGYQTGQGVIVPLMKRGDYLISDRDNHASIVSGNMISGSINVKVMRYRHNNMEDLERVMKKIPENADKLIVTDGVFSTFGNVANLADLSFLAKKYGAEILVDDAHALGVIGENGKGTASKFGLEDEIALTMCTFSKTLASLGGFVTGSERVINYLKHHSPALIFSASPTPSSTAAALAALEVFEAEPWRVDKVCRNAQRIRDGLSSIGFEVPDGETAIVPVIIGQDEHCFKMWRMLFDEGVFVNAFIPPATPPGKSMLRTSYMATHEDEHIDRVVAAFKKVREKMGLDTVATA